MLRNTLFLPLMAAAIGGPLLFFANEGGEQDPAEDEQLDLEEIENVNLDAPQKSFYDPQANLTEIFNFSLTPAAVENKFRQVTKTEIAGFYIYRSSLISGHGDQDIAGAITYQFSRRNRLKSIRFSGFATDPGKLVQFASAQFGFAATNQSGEFRPTTFSGYSGELLLTQSLEYDGQVKISLEVSR